MGDEEKKDEKKDEKVEDEDEDPEKEEKKKVAAIELKNKDIIKYWYELRPEDIKLKEKLKITQLEKNQNELLRRFQIKIWNIKLQNLMNENVDAFIQFIFGGSWRESLVLNKEKIKIKKEYGEMGQYFKTDCVDNIDSKETKAFTLTYMEEVDISYQQIIDQYLDMEIWKYEGWRFNDYYAHTRVKLEDIAKGEITRSFSFNHPTTEKTVFRLSFNIIFQEVWDFHIKYSDFKGIDVQNSKRKECNPCLELGFIVDSKMNQKILTTEKDQDRNPFWSQINDTMSYRGSIADLESQYLQITFYDKNLGFGSDEVICQNMVSLKGCCDTGTIKAELNIMTCNEEKKEKEEESIRRQLELREQEKTTNDENFDLQDELDALKKEIDSRNLSMKCKVEGKINVGEKPKYQQSGDFTAIRSTNIYMIIHIKRVGKMNPPIDRENYNVFMEIEWNAIKRTKVLLETLTPTFNEYLYFQLPFDSELAQNQKKFKDWMKNDFMNKFNVRIDLWAEFQGCNENLGSCNFMMEELTSQQRQELEYFYDEEDKIFNYKSRQFIGKKRLVSAFRSQESILELSVWFMPDIPLTNELKEIPNTIIDYYPEEFINLQKNQNEIENITIYQEWKEKIEEKFKVLSTDFNARRMKRFENLIFIQDQYKMRHLISKFISKVSPPQLMNNVNQPKQPEDDEATKKKKARMKIIKNAKLIKEGKQIEEEEEELIFIQNNSVQTPDEIFHFVRSIPFVESNLQGIWGSPDFLLSAKKGGIPEHCLLLASMMMGCLNEDFTTYKEKVLKSMSKKQIKVMDMTERQKLVAKFDAWDPIGLENRTFVCIGVNKHTEQLHYWVMTIDKEFKEVTFWELRNGLKYVLKNRIKPSEQINLKNFLCPQFETYKDRKNKAFYDLENRGMEKFKKDYANTKAKAKQKLNEVINYLKKFIVAEDNFNDEELQENQLKEQQQQINQQLDRQNENGGDEDNGLLEDNEQNKVKENIMGFTNFDQLMENAKNKALIVRNREEQGGKVGLTKEEILKQRQQMQEEEEAKREDRHLRPQIIYDENDNVYQDNLQMPYESIDLVFNNKNIFMNVRNHEPTNIYYHLHQQEHWIPFLNFTKNYKDKRDLNEEEMIRYNDQDDEALKEAMMYNIYDKVIFWRYELDCFYRTKNVSAPSKSEEVMKLQNEVTKYVKKTIMQIRSGLNLQTKFRQNTDLIPLLMKNYLTEIENYQCARMDQQTFEKKHEKFENNILFFMDSAAEWTFECQPLYFNTINLETIKSTIQIKPPSFTLNKEKKNMFTVAVQIFPFAQKIYSVRIMIAIFYIKNKKITDENDGDKQKVKLNVKDQIKEEDQKDEEDDSQQEDIDDDDEA